MLALLTFWCQNKSGNMGAEDGGVLAPNQFTAIKSFSEVFRWLLGDIFYIEKKSVFLPKCFFQAINQQAINVLFPLPLTQLSVCSIQRHSEEGAASTGPSEDLCKFTRSLGGKGVLGCG